MRDHAADLFTAYMLQPAQKINETGAAKEMILSLRLPGRTLFLGDRGFGSPSLIETIRRKAGMDFLIRVKESWISETRDLPMEELDTTIRILVVTTQRNEDKARFARKEAKYMSGKSKFGKYKSSQAWDYESEAEVEFRVVRLRLPGGAWETLATSLPAGEFSIEDLKRLYYMRWKNIENGFRVLKWDNNLARMHSIREDFAKQEIHARIAMHNMVSCAMRIAQSVERVAREAGLPAGVPARASAKGYGKIISRRFATHLVCDFMKNPDEIEFDVIVEMLRHKVPVRDGRSFKRDMRAIANASFHYR